MTANTTVLSRADIAKITGGNPKLTQGLADALTQIANTQAAVGTQTAATTGLQNATVVTLSANDAFANEKILEVGDGISLQDTGKNAVLSLLYLITLQGGYRCQFDLLGDTELTLPTSGTVLTDSYLSDGPYASDSAAAAGGVAVGGVYRKSDGTVAWRQS